MYLEVTTHVVAVHPPAWLLVLVWSPAACRQSPVIPFQPKVSLLPRRADEFAAPANFLFKMLWLLSPRVVWFFRL